MVCTGCGRWKWESRWSLHECNKCGLEWGQQPGQGQNTNQETIAGEKKSFTEEGRRKAEELVGELNAVLGVDVGILLAGHLPAPMPTSEVEKTEPELWKTLRQARTAAESIGTKLYKAGKEVEKAKAAFE